MRASLVGARSGILIAAAVSLGGFSLGGCALIERLTPGNAPLPGERVAVMQFERSLAVSESQRRRKIEITEPRDIKAWTHAGGAPGHALHHIRGEGALVPLFKRKVARGSGTRTRLLSPPLAVGDSVYILGAKSDLSAVNARTGRRRWRTSLRAPGGVVGDGFGGGIAYAAGKLYAVTGFGDVYAVDAQNGDVIWRIATGVPFRSAPTVRDGRVFAISHDNRLQAFALEDGERLWEQPSLQESATILAASSVAVNADVVVAGFTSGELQSLRAGNGRNNWSDQLAGSGDTVTPLAEISSIIGGPVIDRGRAFAVSHGGEMVAINLRNGARVWDAQYASIQMPWVTGNVIYLMTLDANLLCLTRSDGKLRWVRTLPRNRGRKLIYWNGPILMGGRLRLVSSDGELISFDPETGQILDGTRLHRKVRLAPIAANGILYVLADDGELLAFQ